MPLAGTLVGAIATAGLVVRHNEPYSGLEGLIYRFTACGTGSATSSSRSTNGLLRAETGVEVVAAKVTTALRTLLAGRAAE